MNIEYVRDYCLSLPAASEYFPFDETTLAFRVVDKIFAIDLEGQLTDELIQKLILHSYKLVASKLPRKVKEAHPEIAEVINSI